MKQDFATWMFELAHDQNEEYYDCNGAPGTNPETTRILALISAYNIGKRGFDSTSIPGLYSYLNEYNESVTDDWKEFKRLADKLGVKV